MDQWMGKVAVVTGASSGIGAAVVKQLARDGLTTVGLARRVERVEALRAELAPEEAARLYAIACDITKEEDILRAFGTVCERFGGVDVLINNAGMSNYATALTGSTEDIRQVIDTNLVGVVLCTREAYQSMKNNRSGEGYIVNISSIVGHRVLDIAKQSIYSPTKFAVTALGETIRNDLRKENSKVKVTNISPGIVKTELIQGVPGSELLPALEPEDVADAIRYVLSTPPRVQIQDLIIRPFGEFL